MSEFSTAVENSFKNINNLNIDKLLLQVYRLTNSNRTIAGFKKAQDTLKICEDFLDEIPGEEATIFAKHIEYETIEFNKYFSKLESEREILSSIAYCFLSGVCSTAEGLDYGGEVYNQFVSRIINNLRDQYKDTGDKITKITGDKYSPIDFTDQAYSNRLINYKLKLDPEEVQELRELGRRLRLIDKTLFSPKFPLVKDWIKSEFGVSLKKSECENIELMSLCPKIFSIG